MTPRLPLPLLAALLLSQAVPHAAAFSPISWDDLVRDWQDESITETVLDLSGDGSVAEVINNGGAVTVSQGTSLALNGGHHTISSTKQSAQVFTSRAFDNRGTLEISDCTITGNFNTAVSWFSSSSGGSIANGENARLILSGCSFSNNGMVSQTDGEGGALAGAAGSVMSIQGCDFTNNYVSFHEPCLNSPQQYGGAIASFGAVTLSNCRFSGNYTSYLNAGANGMSTAAGGAVSMATYGARLEGDALEFHGNYAMGYAASGGAVNLNNNASIKLSNAAFTGNYAFCTANSTSAGRAWGGALNLESGSTGTLVSCVFNGNHASSMTETASGGGAIHNFIGCTLTLVNCSFYDNYASSADASLAQGGAIANEGRLRIIANGRDSIFRGNRDHVPALGGGGASNAIHSLFSTGIALYAGNGGSLVFYDGIRGENDRNMLTINKPGAEGYPVDGTVFFKDGASIDGFNTELYQGSLCMGEGTAIRGSLDAWQGSSFIIEGFTTMDGQYSVHAVKPGAAHTVLVRMTDSMAAATEENPVWNFTEGSSIAAFAGSLEFVLDVSRLSIPYDELHPFIFSHEGQTQELMDSVNGAKSVRLVDADGWSYSVDGSFFDYLSGQNRGIVPSGPDTGGWRPPSGVGGVQGNSQWTAVRSLRSFAEAARTREGERLKPDGRAAFWITATGDYFTQASQAAAEGYRFRSHGYSVGGSYDLSPVWTAGGAFGQSFGTNDVNNDLGSFDQDAVMALLQLARSVQVNAEDSLLLGVQGGYGSARSKGGVISPDLAGDRLESSWKDRTWLLDVQGAWTRRLNRKTRLGLYSGLQYAGSIQSASTAAGERHAYHLENSSANVLRGRLGVEFHRNSSLLGREAAGYVRTGIAHDLDRKTPHVSVRGTSRSWTAMAVNPGRTVLEASAGFHVSLSGNWSAGVDYSLEAGNRQLNQSGRAGVMMEF